MKKYDTSDISIPEKIQSPAAGNHHLDRHKKWLVSTRLYHMRRKDIDPEEAVDQTAVDHKKNKTRNKEHHGILRKPAGKNRTKTKNGIEHKRFSNTVTNAENQNSQPIKFTPTVRCGMRINPRINCNNYKRTGQESNSLYIEFPVERKNIFFEKNNGATIWNRQYRKYCL